MEKLNDTSVTSIPKLYWCWVEGRHGRSYLTLSRHSFILTKLEYHKAVWQIGVAQHPSSKKKLCINVLRMTCLNPSACTSLYSNDPHEFAFLTIPIHIHETHHQHRMIAKQKRERPHYTKETISLVNAIRPGNHIFH